ncbi:MAG TPA: ABC transporter ATP-binding protein [Bacilli bacterium]|nr:ABC transporter ATP-binding protein [Bacilli bacterium]
MDKLTKHGVNPAEVIIELKNISKSYDGKTVVDDINLYVKKGEFITLLGPSGCGKTTTLRMIAGFELPETGQIVLNGKDITKLPPYKRPVNTVFQRYALFPHLDVYDNIAFGLKIKKIKTQKNGKEKLRKLTAKEIDERVVKALKMVDLEQFEDRNINTLSGGQQQRVAIARAIVNEPEIILLDEPLGALDLKMRKEMQLELKEMHRQLGLTFIYVTHDQEEALTMSDTIVVMNDGVIQQIGSPTDIYNEPNNPFVADFIGESNIYNARMTSKFSVRFLNAVFTCVDDLPVNEKVDVVVRPEDITMKAPGSGHVDGVIISKVFKGVHYEYVVQVGRKNEVIVQTIHEHFEDEKVGLEILPEAIHIMKKEVNLNLYTDAYINDANEVVIGETAFAVDVLQLFKNATLTEEGYVVANNKKYDLNDIDVVASFEFSDVTLSDDLSEGNVIAQVIQSIWLGDHYQVIVRTDDDEDFIVDTPYLYNEGDLVSVLVDASKIKLKLQGVLVPDEV